MLILALVISFFGFVFAAPGAVMIYGGNINVKKNGKISVAGPLMNLVLALIFLVIMKLNLGSSFSLIGQYGFFINSWLALFNMIPFWNFDGRKIFIWSKGVWISIVAVAVIFLFVL
jgi:Zn-dependent protease